MPSTRSSARGENSSSPVAVKSNKRKASAASPDNNKRSRKDETATKQTTIEETLNGDETEHDVKNTNGDSAAKPEANGQDSLRNGDSKRTEETKTPTDEHSESKESGSSAAEKPATEQNDDAKTDQQDVSMTDAPNAFDQVKAQEGEAGKTTKQEEEKGQSTAATADSAGDALQEDDARKEAVPSNILEKGIIYFFTRGRVGTDDPNSVQDLARSYFVLRPLPKGAKLTEGSIQDAKVSRLLALPKKVWPKSGQDRFMVFVEKAKTDMASLKEEFFQGSEYSTKTQGTNHTPAVTSVGEGVYAITTTGGGQGTTHLAYMLTIPSTISDVQKDLGIDEKGSFVLSLKNPEASGPANAQLPEKPDWPKEFIEEFRGRSWMPVHPKHLDYANAQMLLIGETFDKSTEPAAKDERGNKETPGEELEKLEEEDEHRVQALAGDDSVFVDLGLDSKEYPKVMTTW